MTKPATPSAQKKKLNPYLGFGWVGWVGVVVLVALAIAAYRGWDPVLAFQYVMSGSQSCRGIGTFATILSLLSIPVRYYLAVGPVCLVPAALILIWAPRRSRRRGLWAVLLVSLSVPILFIGPIAIFVGYPIGTFAKAIWMAFDVSAFDALMGLVAVALIGLLSRSFMLCGFWFVWLMLGGAVTNGLTDPWLPQLGHWSWPDYFIPVGVWNAVLIAVTLRWAIHAHLTQPNTPLCPSCDYDLTNLPSSTCPECGGDVTSVIAPEPEPVAAS